MSEPRPDFLIEIPPHRRSEREYAISVLIGEWLGASYTIRLADDIDETRIRLASEPSDAMLVLPDVLLARSTAWLSPASLPSVPLPTMELPTWTGLEGAIPLLYATDAFEELLHMDGHRWVLRLDLLGSLVFMLARYEEYVGSDQRDLHGRFPAGASVAAASGWLEWPILDMYFHVFVAALKVAWPAYVPGPTTGDRVIVSHDVDHPSAPARWRGRQRLRIVAADLVRRRDVRLAGRRAAALLNRPGSVSRADPYNTYGFLMSASEAVGVRSMFFPLALDTHLPEGSTFRLNEPWATRLIAEIADRGHGIGLHGSYDSSTDAARLTEEWAELESACRALPAGVLRRAIRQHYLRWQPGVTWRAQAEAGFAVDHSLGFADAIGYRAGTARSFPAYDLLQSEPLGIHVEPLHVMDVTLLSYLALEWDAAFDRVSAMRRRTRQFGGGFSILWHNSSLETPHAKRIYQDLLRELTS